MVNHIGVTERKLLLIKYINLDSDNNIILVVVQVGVRTKIYL